MEKITLKELGITSRQSRQWMRLASFPNDVFEAALAEFGAAKRMPSTAATIRKCEEIMARKNEGEALFRD